MRQRHLVGVCVMTDS